jgi:glutamate--cysteine ligase
MAIDPAEALRSEADLLRPFEEGCKGRGVELLGIEAEKFGVRVPSTKPVSYDGKLCGVLAFFEALSAADASWQPIREKEGAPLIALERRRDGFAQQISLEPGAQLELSGSPRTTVHAIAQEIEEHFAEIGPTSERCNVRWLSVGYHPLATPAELPWVPKARYAIMREYFPKVGARGLDMMRRTATVQVNMDYADEEDAMRKMVVALKLAPVATAMFANSPFAEGRLTGAKSERTRVWLDTDPDRCGLVAPLIGKKAPRFSDYVGWALEVPMYLFKRDGEVIANTGQTFRSFLADGFRGHRATMGDWVLHLNTLFPEVRLQRTIELRCTDALPRALTLAVPALWAGLLYDEHSLEAAMRLVAPLDPAALTALRPRVGEHGLATELDGRPLRELALEVLELADAGLSRRARKDAAGNDERAYLRPVLALVERGRCPADDLLDGIEREPDLRAAILARTAV